MNKYLLSEQELQFIANALAKTCPEVMQSIDIIRSLKPIAEPKEEDTVDLSRVAKAKE